jgi:hypothetical protein
MAIPGLGNFLIKVGGRTGIPIPVALTPVEWAINDTNECRANAIPAVILRSKSPDRTGVPAGVRQRGTVPPLFHVTLVKWE